MKKILLTTLMLFAFSTQAYFVNEGHNWNSSASNPFKSIMAKTTAGYKEVLAANMAWRDTAKLIKAAKKANRAGKKTLALALAARAYKQVVNAQAQMQLAKTVAPRF